MQLSELLNELRCNILRDVTTGVDREGDALPASDGQLLSDRALVRYINDAENQFARRTRCLVSRSGPVATVALRPGVSEYALDARVIDVLSAHIAGRTLARTTHDALGGGPDVLRGAVQLNQRGEPRVYVLEPTYNGLHVYPTPEQPATLSLAVVRRPMVPMSLEDATRSPEIPEEYHLDLLDWAAFRAMRNHDVDEENFARANSHRSRFLAAIDEFNDTAVLRSPPQFATHVRMP